MKTRKISCAQAKQIDILQILSKLGFKASKLNKNSAWFVSPFRNEKTPSFKVDLKLNLWYDHGEALGGNIIDLVVKIKNCTISEALIYIGNTSNSFSFHKPIVEENKKLNSRQNNSNESYTIVKLKELENPALIQYLNSRYIEPRIAKKYCKEIYYKVNNKNYFSIAFENDLGGYELRNKYSKICLKKKSFSHIKNNSKRIYVFEGFMDFLAYKTQGNGVLNDYDYLILNSISLAKSVVPILKGYDEVGLFLDRDEAGVKTTKFFTEELNRFVDLANKSHTYIGFKDFNEMVVKTKKRITAREY